MTISAPSHDDYRSGFNASAASIAWTVVSSIVAVAIGVSSGSVVLIAFGAVGLCDAIGSFAIAVHLFHAMRGESDSDRGERIAHRIVLGGLAIVGTATIVASVLRLRDGGHSESSVAALVVSALSVFVLAALSVWKRRVGLRIASGAMVADSVLSALGAATALISLVGVASTSAFGWWQVDPIAAIVVAIIALANVVGSVVGASTSD